MRVCAKHGCPNMYPTGEGSQCGDHRKLAEQTRRPNGNPYATAGHRRFRRAVLEANPICVACGIREATIADHYPHTRKELQDRGLNPNDPQYGRGLDKSCHDKHTAATSPGGWNNRD